MGGGRIFGSLLTAVTVMLAGGALVVAGCGGDPDPKAPRGADLTAMKCPLVPSGDAGRGEEYAPAENAFDTAELVGLKLPAAREKAAGHGCEIVVASKDGMGRPVPIEIDPTRIYVFVEDDVVSYVEGVGGGI